VRGKCFIPGNGPVEDFFLAAEHIITRFADAFILSSALDGVDVEFLVSEGFDLGGDAADKRRSIGVESLISESLTELQDQFPARRQRPCLHHLRES